MPEPTLTLEQSTALEEVRRAKTARTELRARLEAEHRERIVRETEAAELALSRAVRKAHERGISKRRIAREGLSTVDPTIVNRIMAKTDNEVAVASAIAAVSAPLPIRELTAAEAAEHGYVDPDAELFVELAYPSFPTQAKDPNYPATLTGVLKRTFGLWYVLDDPSGWVEWELTDWEPTGDVLRKLLGAYADRALAVR